MYDNTVDFVKKGNGQYASMIGEDWDVIPTELDPPRHTAFRKALNPVFSPKNMSALDALVTEIRDARNRILDRKMQVGVGTEGELHVR